MLLDWDDPPQLDAPRRRHVRTAFADREKLARAKAKRAKTTKNHSTNKERSFVERTKSRNIAVARKARDEAVRLYKLAVRAFFIGERDDFPQKPDCLK